MVYGYCKGANEDLEVISEHRLDYLLKYANKLVVMEEGSVKENRVFYGAVEYGSKSLRQYK